MGSVSLSMCLGGREVIIISIASTKFCAERLSSHLCSATMLLSVLKALRLHLPFYSPDSETEIK